MPKLYLAGPFFDDEQIDRISRIEQALEKNKTVMSFFSPRQHDYNAYEVYSPEWAAIVYESDRSALVAADIVVAILDYEDDQVDPGTAWEIGYANALSKPVILVKEKQGKINIMMSVPGHAFIQDVSNLEQYDFDNLPSGTWQGDIF